MSADIAVTWSVEARGQHDRFSWKVVVDRLTRQVAGESAVFYAGRYPSWQIRLHDTASGEVVHLGKDGKPLPVDAMRLDRRTPEQVLADLAADRYEASLERGRDA